MLTNLRIIVLQLQQCHVAKGNGNKAFEEEVEDERREGEERGSISVAIRGDEGGAEEEKRRDL